MSFQWVTTKPVDSDTKVLITATMNRNNKKYKWCISCNNGQGAWGFHWKNGHEEWKIKQGKTDDMITYGLLAQESLREYSNIVNSKQVDLKSRHSGNDISSKRGSFAKSDKNYHNFGKKGHIKKDCKLKDMVIALKEN